MARDSHPDKVQDSCSEFQRISQAYEVIGNDESRKLYDLYGKQLKPCENVDSVLQQLMPMLSFMTIGGCGGFVYSMGYASLGTMVLGEGAIGFSVGYAVRTPALSFSDVCTIGFAGQVLGTSVSWIVTMLAIKIVNFVY